MPIISYEPKNPKFKELIIEKLNGQHFMHHIGFSLHDIRPGFVGGEMLIHEHIKQQTGFIHGGAIATFADLVMGFSAYSLVYENQVTLTADLRISYLNPGLGEKVIAKGWVIKPGAKMIFCEAEVITLSHGKETVIAKASATMAVVNMEELKK